MSQTLKKGMRGQNVRELTNHLVRRGYLERATQTFSNDIRIAVLQFQARHLDSRGRPLTVDGVVGPLTWWALRNENMPREHQPAETERFPMPRVGGAPTGRAALLVALKEARSGAREIGTNNSGRWVKKYLNELAPTPNNWCAGFVSWCFLEAPGEMPFKYNLGARAIRNGFRDRGWIYDPAVTDPEPGDLIFWWRGQPNGWMGHIGFVHRFKDGVVYTIEGNKGAFPAPVRNFDYVLGRIDKLLGFGRVP